MKRVILVLVLVLVGLGFTQNIQEVDVISPQVRDFELNFTLTPSLSPMDGVVALSGVNATSWGELSIIVRCNADGLFDARNGGSYVADQTLAYEAEKAYAVRIVGNVFNSTYSVFVTPDGGDEVVLATDYSFRVPADILLYKCIFTNPDPIDGSLTVSDFEFVFDGDVSDRLPGPLGTEEIRNDAQCDTAWEYLEYGLWDSCPVLHEYTAYQGSITVDGDPSDEDWAKIPWTRFDVYDNIKDGIGRVYSDWMDFDEYWESYMDYCGFFKILWNTDEGVIYFLVKEYDDVVVWPGIGYTDSYAEDIGEVNQWQGDTFEIEMFPMSQDLPGNSLAYIGSLFIVEDQPRYKPLSLSNPPTALELADGDAETEYLETDGKAIFYSRNEETGMNLYEFAIKVQDIMLQDPNWYFGIAKTEGDNEYEDGKNREVYHYWGAGKRQAPQWGSLYFSDSGLPQTAVENRSEKIQPTDMVLGTNYPNPFNPSTTVPFSIKKTDHINIAVYNALGQKVKTLVDESYQAGHYQVIWNGTDEFGQNVVSGVYFVQMKASGSVLNQKILLVK